ncbi:efflux RND transporter permease subunit [Acidisoma cladoniae]|uniref:efflux RND transporter permease subunit n=1 Tax=Acidisoma cladoniae TaxID=3040935 RepID=UPI00254ED55F|nr:efflux RND transporter permease subunit [Acidisoma sp. PAMC 29798]
MSRFFIDRPIFAWVIAIIIMLVGAFSVLRLPVAQYPSIAPPSISISVNYPGASAETVQSTVVQVIEQQLSGLDNLLYFTSESDKDGSISITLSFAQGTDPNIAQVQVQNKLTLATPRLPQAVQEQGITVAKATKNFLMVAGFVSTDGKLNNADLSDFIASSIQDPLSRTKGVGDYQLFGTQYAMRIWLDPAKLDKYSLTPGDVSTAIGAQNVQISAGELGGLPAVPGQELDATIIGPSYLQTADQFGAILLKVSQSGAQVRLRDVAKIALGAEQYSVTSQYNGKPASGIAIKLAAGANALDTVAAIKKTIADLAPTFPANVEVVYPYDTSPFVTLSIEEVIKTLVIAIVLVFLIMYLFLQNFRATLIPTIAVPVVLLGTCGVLSLFGYSLNSLTLFAMVLAIGLLVDDAIVVVENVERVMAEDHLSPREAARKSMDQISGALIGIALVLTAVLLPISFFSGSTGVIYRQFSVTIVSAMVLSVIVALIFTPSLCATLLKPRDHNKPRRGLFGLFNRGFDRTNRGYGRGVGGLMRRPFLSMLAFLAIVCVMVFFYIQIPGGFLPDEDQGVMFVQATAPPGATSTRTQAVLDEAREYFLTKEKANVEGVFTVNGFSFGGRGQNSGIAFVKLKDFSDRSGAANGVQAIAGRAMGYFSTIKDAMVFAFAPPAVLELGNATGFDFELMDNGSAGHDALMNARNMLLGMAAQDPRLVGVRPNGLNDEPQYKIAIDREKASALGLTIANINTTLSAAWGSSYVNDFIDRGRVKRVYIQGQSDSRMLPDDLTSWYVRNSNGTMVPFSAFATGSWGFGSPKLERYNGISSVEILGSPAPGESTGEAMTEMAKLAHKLPGNFGYEWTGLSYEQQQSGSQALYAYVAALVVVFLCLSALYESWTIPVSVLLVVPLGIVGAVLATHFRGLSNDIYFQVGLLVTIGLSAKNAILIVEFAKSAYDNGSSLIDAAAEAARLRLRPIMMTSLAFILGVLPLAVATGAGSGSENAIGTGVVGGMLTATFLAIFLVPVFFVVVLGLFRVKPRPDVAPPSTTTQGTHA